jgi:hypothetical protein
MRDCGDYVLVVPFRASDDLDPIGKYRGFLRLDSLAENNRSECAKDEKSNCQSFHDASLGQQFIKLYLQKLSLGSIDAHDNSILPNCIDLNESDFRGEIP